PPPTSTLFPSTTLFRSVLLFRTACFDVITGHQWQREIYRRTARIRRNVQCQRLALIAQVEQAAIGENTAGLADDQLAHVQELTVDRKSTRLNSSHVKIS